MERFLGAIGPKYHNTLKESTPSVNFEFEELRTVLVQFEDVINARPITCM